MGRGNLIAERLVSKLKANGIIHRNAPVELRRTGKRGWKAYHSVSKLPYGIWSDKSMGELLLPGGLRKDATGKVTRKWE